MNEDRDRRASGDRIVAPEIRSGFGLRQKRWQMRSSPWVGDGPSGTAHSTERERLPASERSTIAAVKVLLRWLGWTSQSLGLLALLAGLICTAARAADLTASDAKAVRKVVEAQLDAFAAGDAERAFSFASTEIQSQFGDAAHFLAMVRDRYPMVVRPAAVSFFQARANDGSDGTAKAVRQTLRLRDRQGHLWRAVYLLQRQAGPVWRISACVVVADSGGSET